jgi:hypothetical protein
MPWRLYCSPSRLPVAWERIRNREQCLNLRIAQRTECRLGINRGPDGRETRLPVYPEQRTSSRRPSWSGLEEQTLSQFLQLAAQLM